MNILSRRVASVVLCAGAALLPVVNAQTAIASPASQSSPAPDTAKKAVSETSGFVKSGDAIRISAIPDTGSFVNGFYPVDGEGRIYLPIIGKMRVVDMSEKMFLDTLKSTYINYLRYPNIQVRPLIRLSLLGGFQRPGLYYIDPDNSMWDAVYIAGGPVREDGLIRMKWERDRKKLAKDLIPYVQSGQSLRALGFKSGDQLWTPSKERANVWNVIVQDVLLREVVPIVSTAASLYMTYLTYKSLRDR